MAKSVKHTRRRKPTTTVAAAIESASDANPVEAAEADMPLRKIVTLKDDLQDDIARYRTQRFAEYVADTGHPTRAVGGAPAHSRRFAAAATAAGVDKARELRILAEGDSWFEYPFRGIVYSNAADGVIYRLEKEYKYRIANMAHHGDEVRQMMGLKQREEITARLAQRDVRFDALLFSGGGNDCVGDQFLIWLKESPAGTPPTQLLDADAVKAGLGFVEAGFRDLIRIRDRYSRGTVIFVHGYDSPPVTGKGVCGVGPWLKPSLDYLFAQNGDPFDQAAYDTVVRTFLTQFQDMLISIEQDPAVQDFVVVRSQGTLAANEWQNEIHPTGGGFSKVAALFDAALQKRFP